MGRTAIRKNTKLINSSDPIPFQTPVISPAIQKAKHYLQNQNDISFAMLFGSRAKGKNLRESDTDIGIYMNNHPSSRRNNQIWRNLEKILNTDVDLVLLNEVSPITAWAALRGFPLAIKNRRFFLEYMLSTSREAEDLGEFLLDFWRWRRRLNRKSNK